MMHHFLKTDMNKLTQVWREFIWTNFRHVQIFMSNRTSSGNGERNNEVCGKMFNV